MSAHSADDHRVSSPSMRYDRLEAYRTSLDACTHAGGFGQMAGAHRRLAVAISHVAQFDQQRTLAYMAGPQRLARSVWRRVKNYHS